MTCNLECLFVNELVNLPIENYTFLTGITARKSHIFKIFNNQLIIIVKKGTETV